MGTIKVALGLGLGLVVSACHGDDGSSRGEFVEYWADGDTWCEHQACGDLQLKKSCELAWPKLEDVEEALELADVTDGQLSKCRQSSQAFDDCFLDMPCEGLSTNATVICPDEYQRYELDCANVLDAFEMIGADEL